MSNHLMPSYTGVLARDEASPHRTHSTGDWIIMAKPRILAFAGATREGSHNKQLAKFAATAAEATGAEVTYIDLREYPLPLYDGDLEAAEGLPGNARALKDLFLAHDALIIASPEYNSSLTAVLKNTIDWISRPVEGEPALAAFQGKTAAILAASPGALGGLRGLVHLRSILGNIGVLVLPDQLAIGRAHEAFDETGELKDARQSESVKALVGQLVRVASRLKAEE